MPHEPKKRQSKAAKRTRRAAIKLAELPIINCSNCNQKTIAHMACRNCGFFAGKKVTDLKQKTVVTRV